MDFSNSCMKKVYLYMYSYNQYQLTLSHTHKIQESSVIAIQTGRKFSWAIQLNYRILVSFLAHMLEMLQLFPISSVTSNSLRPHELQHARPPCPSPTPVHPNPRPSSRWCHPAISSSAVPFFSCPQSFPASEHIQVISINHWFLWSFHEWLYIQWLILYYL